MVNLCRHEGTAQKVNKRLRPRCVIEFLPKPRDTKPQEASCHKEVLSLLEGRKAFDMRLIRRTFLLGCFPLLRVCETQKHKANAPQKRMHSKEHKHHYHKPCHKFKCGVETREILPIVMVGVGYVFSKIHACTAVAFAASINFRLSVKRGGTVVAWLYVVLAVAARTGRQCLEMLDIVFA